MDPHRLTRIKIGRQPKIMAVLYVLIISLGVWLAFSWKDEAQKQERSQLLRQAGRVTEALDSERIKLLAFDPSDSTNLAYQQLTEQLNAYAEAVGLRNLYVVAQKGEQLLMGPGGDLPPGTPLSNPSSTIKELFRTGVPQFNGPLTDDTGKYLEAVVSVSKNQNLAVCVEMDASAWNRRIREAVIDPLLATILPPGLILLGWLIYCKKFAPLNLKPQILRNLQVADWSVTLLLLTAILTLRSYHNDLEKQHDLFEMHSSVKSANYAQAFQNLDTALHLTISFMESSEEVSPEEFSQFCRYLVSETSAQSLMWLPELKRADVADFIQQMREQFPDFSIQPFSDTADLEATEILYPATYVEAVVGRALLHQGYDFNTDPEVRNAIESARLTGLATSAISPKKLRCDCNIFVFEPLKHPPHEGMVALSANLEGIIDDLSSQAHDVIPGISTTLFSLESASSPEEIGSSEQTGSPGHKDLMEFKLQTSIPIFAFGKTFMILLSAGPEWVAFQPHNATGVTLAIGLVLTLVFSYIAFILCSKPIKLEQEVQERTQELENARKAAIKSRENFRITLNSIGDGVIATTIDGAITSMNPMAEKLTGWTEQEAQGHPIEEVFQVINEHTRNPIENPVHAVLKSGKIVGLANHTLLITKAGREIPVADSGAPILNNTGEITGVVLVFRDQTQERMNRRFIEFRLELMQFSATHSLDETLVLALDRAGELVESPIGFYHTVTEDQKGLILQQWSSKTMEPFCKAEGHGMHYDVNADGVWADAVRDKAPVVHNDYASLPNKKGMPEDHAMVFRELVVPVIRQEKVVSVLGVGNKPVNYSDEDVRILSSFGDVIWKIVEQKLTETALQQSERKYRMLFENMSTGFALHEMIYDDSGEPGDYRFLEINTAFEKMTGLNAKTLIGKTVKEVLPETEPYWIEVYDKVARTGESVSIENYSQELGKYFDVRVFCPAKGQFATLVTDITDRIKTHKAIKESQLRLQRAQKVAHVGNWEFDLTTHTAMASDETKRIYGLSDDTVPIHEVQKIPLPKYRKMLDNALSDLINKNKPYDLEFEIKNPKDGHLIYIHSVAEFNPEENRVFGVIQDITARKQAERELKALSEIQSSILNNSSFGIALLENRIFKWVNPRLCELLNLDAEELTGSSTRTLYHSEEEYLHVGAEAVAVMSENKRFDYVLQFTRPDGTPFWCRLIGKALDPKKPLSGTSIWMFEDITEQKEAQEKLIRLSTAIEQSPEAIVITDIQGNIEYVNPAFEKVTGYSEKEALGKNPRVLKSDKHPDSFYKEMWNTISSGNVWEGRIINRRKNGTLFTEEASIAPVKDSHGKIVNYVAVKRDISEELVREEEFQQAQKMEAVGQLAGGIAHDFNNILQGILSFSELLLLGVDEKSEEYDYANEIRLSARRAARLTQQLLAFSRKQPTEHLLVDLNNAVHDSAALLDVLMGENIKVELNLQDNLPTIIGDYGQLSQIIMNLAVNARDAMSEAGKLTISTKQTHISENEADSIADASPGEFVCLSVQDTGCGMDQATIARIFEPFFTTKPLGHGTGLGLSVVYGIVKQNKGWINLQSELGHGTCIEIFLPISNAADSISETDNSTYIPKHHILFTGNDPEIGALISDLFDKHPHSITMQSTIDQALEWLAQPENSVDLFIFDMDLADMEEKHFAETLRTNYPELPVLLLTGFKESSPHWKNMEEYGIHLLNKPFTITSLLKMTSQLLKEHHQ